MKEPDDKSRRCFLKASSIWAWQPRSDQQRSARYLQSPEVLERRTPCPEPVLHKRPTRLLFVRFR